MNSNQYDEKEQLKKAQIKIAKEIKRICEKNNINYFLDAGSMLGAVRHNGFIPWDDDMDIGMLDKDYQRFLQLAPKELGEEFFLDNYELDKDYGLVFSKMRLKNTIYKERLGSKTAKHQEIFVDIFSYINRPENEKKRRIQSNKLRILSQIFMAQSGFHLWDGNRGISKIKFLPIIILAKTLNKDRVYRRIYKISKCEDSKIIGVHDGISYHYWFYDSEYLNEFIDIQFENEVFRIPAKYNEILTITYGEDYMQLPPIEKRRNHEILELDLGNVKI